MEPTGCGGALERLLRNSVASPIEIVVSSPSSSCHRMNAAHISAQAGHAR